MRSIFVWLDTWHVSQSYLSPVWKYINSLFTCLPFLRIKLIGIYVYTRVYFSTDETHGRVCFSTDESLVNTETFGLLDRESRRIFISKSSQNRKITSTNVYFCDRSFSAVNRWKRLLSLSTLLPCYYVKHAIVFCKLTKCGATTALGPLLKEHHFVAHFAR